MRTMPHVSCLFIYVTTRTTGTRRQQPGWRGGSFAKMIKSSAENGAALAFYFIASSSQAQNMKNANFLFAIDLAAVAEWWHPPANPINLGFLISALLHRVCPLFHLFAWLSAMMSATHSSVALDIFFIFPLFLHF